MKRLRRKSEWHTFWADALSINQAQTKEGLKEKSNQVQLMSSIFTKANKVVIDLGHADENTGLAIDLMRKMSSLSPDQIGPNLILRPDFERLGLPGLDDPAWQAWMDLSTREWFNRVWMVQEFALACHFDMMIGPYIFDGSLIEKAYPISTGLQPPTDALLQSVFRSERSLRGLAAMTLIRKMYRNRDSLRLVDLYGMCSSFMATDKKDHIYALWGLAKNDITGADNTKREAESFTVDYGKSIRGVAIDFAKYLATRLPASLIWIYANGPHPDQPSWTPCLDTHSLRMPSEGLFPNLEERPALFRAGGTSQPRYSFLVPDTDSAILTTQGRVVDTIAELTETFKMGLDQSSLGIEKMGKEVIAFEQKARTMLGEHGFPSPFRETDGTAWDPYYRTLISDTAGSGGRRAGAELMDSFHAFATVSNMVSDGRATGDVEDDPLQMALLIRMMPYMLEFSSAMFKRRICVTKKGRIGNVVDGTKVGDQVVLIGGVDRPTIMRKNDSGLKSQFIGMAYVDGIMDGEGLEGETEQMEEIQVV